MGIFYSGLAMGGLAAIMGVVRLFLTLPGRKKASSSLPPANVGLGMAIAPPAFGMIFFIAQTVAVSRLRGPEILDRSQLVCVFGVRVPFILRNGHYLILIIPLVVVFFLSVYLTIRVRATLNTGSKWSWRQALRTENGAWFAVLMRIIIFEVLCGIGAILLDTVQSGNQVFHLLAEAVGGLLPLAAFLVFGTTERVRGALFSCCISVRKENLKVEKADSPA
ncbi:hypothetical protein EXIGLDRAFT_309555 [Exidia glandulosa HHB12029]|uniref:Uncharacterized protein n=1 Tax=Exidia glandulosa HHB12029 TaxID=1314781 RepID=A0A165D0V3_EXIGL|nr:hypothetical protein EXIGLDRAFT_309555 [Exidia glandulosa HHB12029]